MKKKFEASKPVKFFKVYTNPKFTGTVEAA
jgi:hypothetical protein